MKFISALIIIYGISPSVYAQPDSTVTPVTKGFQTDRMADDIKVSDEASKYLKKADKFFNIGPDRHKQAIENYKKALYTNTDNAFLNYKLGYGYLFTNINKLRAITYLEKAYAQNKRIDDNIQYYIALANHYNSNLEDALKGFEEYIANYKKYNRSKSQQEIDSILAEPVKRMEECRNGLELMKKPARVHIDNIGDSINSEYPEYNPNITADESMLLFTSRREDTKGGKTADIDAQYYEDIYVSYNNNGQWSKAKNLSSKLNKKTNDAIIGLSVDGEKAIVYNDYNGGDIFISELKGSRWGKPRGVKAINSIYNESSACFSPDGNTIYFVSDRADSNSVGGKDIYVSNRIKKNKWSAPENIGHGINTIYDEERVSMHPGGNTLYFCSKGHNSMGGYDLFKVTLKDDETWSEPENLGYPINSANDDLSFVISPNGKTAYYSSFRSDGKGSSDIYRITFLGAEKPGIVSTEDNLLANLKPVKETVIEPPVVVRKNRMSILKGVIKDAITLDLLEAEIEITDNEKNKIISSFNSNSETGKYLVSLKSGKNYGIAVKSKGYLFHSENIILPASSNFQVIEKDVNLNKLDVGSKIVLRNIFFDTGKDSLRPESFAELARLTKLLNDFPYLRIEISGHTDDVGSDQANQELSEKRAKAVVNYLILEGTDIERLEYKGYGEIQPISSNDTDEGKQMNRRTEFTILGTDYKPSKKKKPPAPETVIN